ncbi:hypothetical protein R6Q57_008918, partial [Mikania cordata]
PLLEKGVRDKTRKELFDDNIRMLLTNLNIKNLNKIDLFFIPIIHNEHVFVLVFDMKNPAFEVIENMATGLIKLDRYSHIPAIMKYVFANYLLSKDHLNALKIYHLTPTLLDIQWKTTKNGVDCGVFSMMHMETYMGGGLKKWKTGLNQEFESQKKEMRTSGSYYESQKEVVTKVVGKGRQHGGRTRLVSNVIGATQGLFSRKRRKRNKDQRLQEEIKVVKQNHYHVDTQAEASLEIKLNAELLIQSTHTEDVIDNQTSRIKDVPHPQTTHTEDVLDP